jgi:hypothetical protein
MRLDVVFFDTYSLVVEYFSTRYLALDRMTGRSEAKTKSA